MIIERINHKKDLDNLSINELEILANEIRHLIIKKASIRGGHLASNLGVIELTIALHYVFDFPNDKVVFDVSHQCYTHKILTGRKDAFCDEEKYDSVTGFTNPLESHADLFNIGHTSTSISLACGLAKARDLRDSNENIVAVIGDSALDGGEAFEALNYLGESESKMIIVVNDNHMSIPENHGFLNDHLDDLYRNKGVSEKNIFKTFGFSYIFVEDGHDISSLIRSFREAKEKSNTVVVHCRTTKGKGYSPAEQNPEKWHHAYPFNIITAEFLKTSTVPKENYGSIVGEYLLEKIKTDKKTVAMTASVPACFGFNSERRRVAGDQFIDVGICEQHLISMACGLAKEGFKPVLITESSFYQRAYDQIEQEMCINKCPVTLLIAFSGIYGHNDDTHIGFYDIGLFGSIPNLIYLAPSNKQDYLAMLEWSINTKEYPVAIRIPWNGVRYTNDVPAKDYSTPRYVVRSQGEKVAIIGVGSFYHLGEEVADLLQREARIKPTIIDPQFISGCDEDCLQSLMKKHELVVTIEDGLVRGGFGSRISQFFGPTMIKVLNFGFKTDIPTKFDTNYMLENNDLTIEKIYNQIVQYL